MNTSKMPKRQAGYILTDQLIDEIKHEAVRQRSKQSVIVETACRQYLKRQAKRRNQAMSA